MPPTEPVRLKVCLVGDEGVGKTSLVRRYVLSEFDERYLRTIGTVVRKRIVVVPAGGAAHAVTLTVWDILGRRDFLTFYEAPYFVHAAGVLAVCDLTRPETLEGLGEWMDRVRSVAGDVPAIVLANKRDLEEHVRVDEDELLAFCEVYGTPCLETSAKTGENVELAFGKLAEIALQAALEAARWTGGAPAVPPQRDETPPAASIPRLPG